MADTLNNNFFDKGLPKYTEENGSKLPASLRSFDGGSILILNEAERMDTFLSLFVVLQLMVNRHPVSKRYYDELCLNEHGISNPNPCYQKVFDQLQGAKEKMNTISEPLYTSNNHLRNKRSPNRRRSNMPRGVNRPSRMNKHYPQHRGVTGYIITKRPGNRRRLNKPRGVKRPTRRPSRKGKLCTDTIALIFNLGRCPDIHICIFFYILQELQRYKRLKTLSCEKMELRQGQEFSLRRKI